MPATRAETKTPTREKTKTPGISRRGGRYYIRTRVQVLDPTAPKGWRWKQVEKPAGTNLKGAKDKLQEIRRTALQGSR